MIHIWKACDKQNTSEGWKCTGCYQQRSATDSARARSWSGDSKRCFWGLTQDLGLKCVLAKFILQLLLPEQEEHHAAVANDLIQTATNEPDFLKKVITGDELWVYGYDLETQACRPNGRCLVLQAQRRHSKATARSRPCYLCFLIGEVLSITSTPLQAKQLIRSTTSVFFIGWRTQYDENSHSYVQLVTGSFITATRPLMHHVLCRVFLRNIKSPRWLSPHIAQIWHPTTSGFSQN